MSFKFILKDTYFFLSFLFYTLIRQIPHILVYGSITEYPYFLTYDLLRGVGFAFIIGSSVSMRDVIILSDLIPIHITIIMYLQKKKKGLRILYLYLYLYIFKKKS